MTLTTSLTLAARIGRSKTAHVDQVKRMNDARDSYAVFARANDGSQVWQVDDPKQWPPAKE
ncbi:MAG: hypothetical protein ACR2M4_06445 [Actinomycetota bacterium]